MGHLTPEQADAVAAWQAIGIEAHDQWDVYCSFKGGAGSEAAYARWREIYVRREDALTSMIHALWTVGK